MKPETEAREAQRHEVDDGTCKPAEYGARRFGKSAEHRDDRPQVARLWSPATESRCAAGHFPAARATSGSSAPSATTQDRGTCTGWFGSPTPGSLAANRAYLTRGGGHYIHAEKLRHTNAEAAAAQARPGRYHHVADNLRVKDVRVAPGGGRADGARAERFVVCHNPDAADRDAAVPRPAHRVPVRADRRLRHRAQAQTQRSGRLPTQQAWAAKV